MSTPTCHIDLGERSYDIHIGTDCLNDLGDALAAAAPCVRAALVVDDTVAPLYAAQAEASLEQAGIDCEQVVFPAGEASKSLRQLEAIGESFQAMRLDRKGVVVALGGGVTGDLAGFAAASWMRGVRFVQVPTSLLAMVDSSSGGKTGVNLPHGKNLIGAFHQPSLVWIDTRTLETLPRREFLCGLAEIIKHGVIRDADYFRTVETHAERLLDLDHALLRDVVRGSCRIKGEVVSADEREAGCRALLNFGHTFGHAYESLSAYAIHHGEAVAMGMIAACHAAEDMLGTSPALREQLDDCLRRLGLPRNAPEEFDPQAVLDAMAGDKKNDAGALRLVLARRLGEAEVVRVEDPAPVRRAIEATRGRA